MKSQLAKDLSFRLDASPDKAVLLVHGLTGAPSEMRYLGKQLHRQGFTVVAPLLAGHGADAGTLLKTNWRDWYATVEEQYLKLKQSFPCIYIAGICVGGALGLYLASRHKEVAGVTVFSPTLRYDGWNTPKYYALASLIPMVAKLPFTNRLAFKESFPFGLKDERLRKRVQAGEKLVEGSLDAFPFYSVGQMYRLSRELKRILPGIHVPTQLIHAREDDLSHPRNAEYIASHIGGPCRIEWLEDSYHMLHVDQERRKVAELTGNFFGMPQHSKANYA